LIQALVLDLLLLDVLAEHRFVSPDGRDEVTARPEVLPDEVAAPFTERPRDMDGTLALDLPDDLRDRVLWRDRDHHVHMVHPQVALLDLALLLLRKRPEHRTQVPSQVPVQYLATALRKEHHVVFALPLRVA
jgi:hypothetical protein